VVQSNSNLFIELGSSGLEHFGGYVHDEKLRQLMDPRRRNHTFREMGDNDPIAGGVLFYVDMLCRQVKWTVEAPANSTDPQMDEKVEFLQSCLDDLDRPFSEVISEILSFIQFGWSWHEIVVKYRHGPQSPIVIDEAGALVPGQEMVAPSRFNDGKIGLAKLPGRAQDTLDRWILDEHGGVHGIVQNAPPLYRPQPIAATRSLHFRTTARGGNPEGVSIFRRAYRPWYFKKTFEEIQAIGVERDLAGLPVFDLPLEYMRAKSNLNENQLAVREAAEKMIRNIRRGQQEGVLAPSDVYTDTIVRMFDIRLLGQTGRRQFDVRSLLEYYDVRIAMMAAADVVLLGHEKVGSFALADNKTEMLAVALGVWLDTVTEPFTRHAFPLLLELNGYDTTEVPELKHSDLDSQDLGVIGEYIAKLASAGMSLFPSPDGKLEQRLLDEAGLPAPTEEQFQEALEIHREMQDQARQDFQAEAEAKPEEPLAEPIKKSQAVTVVLDGNGRLARLVREAGD